MNMLDAHIWLEQSFTSYFSNHEYSQLGSVGISSKIDPTVYLVNSATNLFKQYFGEDNVSVFTYQKSMRTQILTNYYQVDQETEFPSFFESYGAYVSLDNLDKIINDSIEFFITLGFDCQKMRVRAAKNDPILIDAIDRMQSVREIHWDDRLHKYDHHYGDDVTGHAIKLDYYQAWAKKHKNLCYFILIYKQGIPIGAELATSDQLILMRLNELKYAISASKVSDILPLNSFYERRFADSIVGMAHMIYEGIRPNSSNTNGRTLKKYIVGALSFGQKIGYSPHDIATLLKCYVSLEYSSDIEIDMVISCLESSNNKIKSIG